MNTMSGATAISIRRWITRDRMFGIVFALVLFTGIFLRTYHFHEWLQFRDDQNRDAVRVDRVISGQTSWPLLGPFLSHTAASEDESFHVGPIYYYFQIVSAKIFGSYPDRLAYPDVFFSILSLPLFFLFLRMYFDRNLSLGLTALYAVSAYLISYSRFAWSSNPIPFFVLLFLYALLRFPESRDGKAPWSWAIALGAAWGVGFQLHAITMILFSGIVSVVFLRSMRSDRTTWRRWTVVFLVFLLFNAGQIVNEAKTNFGNTKAFFGFFTQDNANRNNASGNILTKLKNDVSCHIEANFLYMSSYRSSFGLSNCSRDYSKILSGDVSGIHTKRLKDKIDILLLLFGFLFSVGGYVFLWYDDRRERVEGKKRFLHLLALYSGFGFLVMLPLSDGSISDLRYFSFLFFIPYVFLGFYVKFAKEKCGRRYVVIPIITVFSLLVFSDFSVISTKAAMLSANNGTCSGTTTLGEMESVAGYLVSRSDGRTGYVAKDRGLSSALNSLIYLADKQGMRVERTGDTYDDVPDGAPVFFMSCGKSADMRDAYNYSRSGELYVYQIR